jgi:hypothetical protein
LPASCAANLSKGSSTKHVRFYQHGFAGHAAKPLDRPPRA